MKKVDDRRVSGRARPLHQLAVANAVTGESLGIVQDLAMGGIGLVHGIALEVDATFELSIEVPPGMEGPNVLIDARVCWCRKVEGADTWEAGLEFPAPESDVLKRVAELIFRHCRRQV